MPCYYSRPEGKLSEKTLLIDDYILFLDSGILSPELKKLGFRIYVVKNSKVPKFTSEEEYIEAFRAHWTCAVLEIYAKEFETTKILPPADLNLNSFFIPQLYEPVESLPSVQEVQSDLQFAESVLSPISEETPEHFVKQFHQESAKMATAPTRRPSLLVNGLPSVQEDGNVSTTTSPVVGTVKAFPTPAANPSSTISPQRDAAKMNMLRRMRPPPFQYAWTFYHDKHSEDSNYEGRLTVLLENIITLKPFWEAYNRFPLGNLKMKDSVHFFKRGVKPVWEDPRNVRGGAWTFRVPKDKSEQTWKEMLLLAVGEQFADVIQPSKSFNTFMPSSALPFTNRLSTEDDLCGLSLGIRFSSHLITIWNRDGNAQASIDGIRDVILAKISPEIRPKDGSYYYKKHSEHAGFSEVLAKAEEKALISGKIEEAKVKEGEVERLEEEEKRREEEEARARGRASTIG